MDQLQPYDGPADVPEEIQDWYRVGPYAATLKDLTSFDKIVNDLRDTGGPHCVRTFYHDGCQYMFVNHDNPNAMRALRVLLKAEQDDELLDQDDIEIMIGRLVDRAWAQMELPDRVTFCSDNNLDYSHVLEVSIPDVIYTKLTRNLRNVDEFNEWRFQGRKRPRR